MKRSSIHTKGKTVHTRESDPWEAEQEMTTTASPSRATQGNRTKFNNKKIIIEFPKPLLQRADFAATELATNRSQLIRDAVETYVGGLEKSKLERDLAAAYKANSSLALHVARKFAVLDGDDQ